MPSHGLLDILLESCASDVVPVLVAVALAWACGRRPAPRPVGWLVAYVVADDVIALIPLLLGWNFGRWNWIGQSASLLFSLAVARLFFNRDDIGLRLPRSRREVFWTLAAIAGALAVAMPGAVLAPVTRPDLETFAFEATLPGPVEELVFRGIGLALLLRAFPGAGSPDRTRRLVASLVTAIWFTAGHVVHLDHAHVDMRWDRVLDVFPMALWYVFVRLRSGSLLGGVLAHNAANILVEMLAALRS